jgi:hypothetical protein
MKYDRETGNALDIISTTEEYNNFNITIDIEENTYILNIDDLLKAIDKYTD